MSLALGVGVASRCGCKSVEGRSLFNLAAILLTKIDR